MRLFKKSRSATLKSILAAASSAPFVSLSLVISLSTNAVSALSESPLTHCGRAAELLIPVVEHWESIPIEPALCTFRSKNGGFPTLTVLKTAPPSPFELRSLAAKKAFLQQSYTSAGLLSAHIADLHEEQLHGGVASYQASVSFVNHKTAMLALVTVIELPDRNYILTLQDRAEFFENRKREYQQLMRQVRVRDGWHGILAEDSQKSYRLWFLALLLLVSASTCLRKLIRQHSRKQMETPNYQ